LVILMVLLSVCLLGSSTPLHETYQFSRSFAWLKTPLTGIKKMFMKEGYRTSSVSPGLTMLEENKKATFVWVRAKFLSVQMPFDPEVVRRSHSLRSNPLDQ